MVTYSWDEARRNRGDEILHMKKLIPFYSYATERRAILTDKRFCIVLKGELVKSKVHFSDAIDWLYKKEIDCRKFERTKDDFDILFDEIDIKPNKWDERIPREFLEKIMEFDWKLIQKSWMLEKDFSILLKFLQSKPKSKSLEEQNLKKIRISMDVINEKIDDITQIFKEREVAFDITRSAFRDIFNRLRDRISKSV